MEYINGNFYHIGDIAKVDNGTMYKIIGFTKLKIKANVLIRAFSREPAEVEINDTFYFIGNIIYKIPKKKVIERVYQKYLPPLETKCACLKCCKCNQIDNKDNKDNQNIDLKISIIKYSLKNI